MRATLVLLISLFAGSAQAGSLLTSSARLLDEPGLELFGIRQSASPVDEPLPAPPLLTAPGGDLPSAPPQVSPELTPQPPRASTDPRLQLDPHAGGMSWRETFTGTLMVLGADVLSLGLGLMTGILYAAGSNSGDGLAAVIMGVLVAGVADFVLVPFAAALGVYTAGNRDEAGGGFLGALAGAWVAQLGSIALYAGLALAILPLQSGGSADTYGSLSSVITLLGLALHDIAIPAGASWGFHWNTGRADAAQASLGASRRPERFVVRPSDAPATARAASVQVVALRF
ncbi:MAG: hypothetical protein WBV82_13145 [Myxococcaceae bacterium]